MITVANRIYVNPEYHDQFAERFRERAGLVDGMPGFVANHVLRPTKEGEPFVVLTFWESREAFEAWTQSDAFRQGHARSGSLPREAFSGPNVLEMHEVVTSTPQP
ncbi:antibiotic biosynthesis monooxygenase [Deinococcus sp. Leaf326]|uniref:antibiotic biosynthesis monooxygenase family protein n=1 Tax=Deinococcus sp. Leaf326 TaxID=1736338 RepID=UPI0006F76478|nr:antibiotic biosynthesis monooxygenase [Deinococcus sp. Leaf326]KQR40972.1 antibiotic biosynthesis monooxygenase [Deinococcus sp. Leaf326]